MPPASTRVVASRRRWSWAAAMALASVAACREDDPTQLLPSSAATQQAAPVRTSDLRAGGIARDVAARNPYDGDARALATGRQLYASMNCAGCHGPAGGGGIGPPFADAEWIYGSEPENIVQSVLQGRPNGMPSFAGKLPPDEVWKLAAFVTELARAGQKASGTDRRGPAVTASKDTSAGAGR
jgi:cytochrome c oxidase cbb3-type subunit III